MAFAMFVLAAAFNPGGLVAWLVVGLDAGGLAGVLMPGPGFGLVGDLLIGLVGALVEELDREPGVPRYHVGLLGHSVGARILVAMVHAVVGRGPTTTRLEPGSVKYPHRKGTRAGPSSVSPSFTEGDLPGEALSEFSPAAYPCLRFVM